MKETVMVPRERLGVVKAEDVRKEIEDRLGVRLEFIDNSVEIEGEGVGAWQATGIVKAMARGFSPERAFRLFDEEQQLEIMELKQYTEKRAEVLKSRVIGKGGKTRKRIEDRTGAAVSVYGKTVSIIGDWEQVKNAKEAIQMLLKGSKHTSVYRFLEKL